MSKKRFVEHYAGRIIKRLIGIEDIETGRVCVTIKENIQLLNELNDENAELKKENEQLKQQLNRLYNYFEDWYSDMTSANDFSEIWDNVKEDERWD